jgi:hypothetical protein
VCQSLIGNSKHVLVKKLSLQACRIKSLPKKQGKTPGYFPTVIGFVTEGNELVYAFV